MHPLALLPEEMWVRVFDNLATHENLLAAYYTCQLWNSLLGKKQTEWMFQGVFPSLMKYLPKTDILTCRRVSKQWNEIIDSFLESNQPPINAAGNPYKQVVHYKQRCLLVDINQTADRQNKSVMETLKRFQTEFNADKVSNSSASVKNPFVARSLDLTIAELNSTVLEFFEKFGAHLSFLQLTICITELEKFVRPVDIFRFVWKILGHVPNLKKLVLETYLDLVIFYDVFGTAEEWSVQDLEVKQFLARNSVPSLPYLNNCRVTWNINHLQRALESAYASQLNKFVYDMMMGDSVPQSLTKLTELVWHHRPDFGDNQFSGCNLFKFSELHTLNCPSLQRLCIIVNLFNPNKSPSQRVFSELETFKNSLKYLYIFWSWYAPTFPSQLNLPLVEELSLELDEGRDLANINLSFLTTLQSLRRLKFIFNKRVYLKLLELRENREHIERADESVDVQYHLSLERDGELYNSNVWRLVPTLETVVVDVFEWLEVEQEGEPAQYVKNVKTYTRWEMARNG